MGKRLKHLISATFTITERQLLWLKQRQSDFGLTQSELLRRAIDEYIESEEAKDRKQLFTPEQIQDLQEAAAQKGVTVTDVIRKAINKEMNSFFQRF